MTGTESFGLHQRQSGQLSPVAARYAALAVFFRVLTAFDWGFAEAFFLAAQKAFIRAACCLR